MGEWVHQDQINETVGWFVRTALPDAEPGWEDLPWSVDEMGRTDDRGRWWTIAGRVGESMSSTPSFGTMARGCGRFRRTTMTRSDVP